MVCLELRIRCSAFWCLFCFFCFSVTGYGKDKVSVYVMSGIDGVGDLPTENVSCKFTKNAFDLKVWDGFVHLEIAFSTATVC